MARIAVYGATGFTGGLIARELRGLGADLVLAGRSPAKLAPLAAELGGAETVAVGLDDPAGLRKLLGGCDVVIGAAGPFVAHGEPLLAAAAETGTHYLDTTGEQPFIRATFDRYGTKAAETGAALVSGMGFDYAPGDLLAALTSEGMGRLDEITVAYSVNGFAPTRGTGLSALEMLAGGDVVWRDGEWQAAPRDSDGGVWSFPEPIGEQRMLRYPAGEQVTVPRHVETARVRTLLSGMVVPPPVVPLAVAAVPLLGAAMRRPRLRRAAAATVRRMPAAPSQRVREAATFVIECEARAGERSRRGLVVGSDVYGLTGALLARAATRCADPGFDRAGALAPAQAFGAASLLDEMADRGLSYEVDRPPARGD